MLVILQIIKELKLKTFRAGIQLVKTFLLHVLHTLKISVKLTSLMLWKLPGPFLRQRQHRTPEEFEKATLFLRLGLPFTLICHANKAFRKRWRHDNHIIFLIEFSSTQIPSDCCGFKFLWHSTHRKHLRRFQSETRFQILRAQGDRPQS